MGRGGKIDSRFEIRDKVKQMTYKRFEDVPVWKDAVRLAKMVFDISGLGSLRSYSGMKDQIERAAVPVSNNIAEGFERGTNGELITFLYIAKGSAGEVRSMLHVLREIAPDAGMVAGLGAPQRLSESISKQLCGWIEAIKASGLKGNRSQTPETRQKSEQIRRAEAFDGILREVQANARRTVSPPPAPPEG